LQRQAGADAFKVHAHINVVAAVGIGFLIRKTRHAREGLCESFEQNEDIEFASAMQGTHVQGTYIYLCTGHVHLSMLKRPPSPNFAEKAALVSALFLSSSTIGRRFETVSQRSHRGEI
jgi:hypothetical protein